eukprot:TRINITY_DN8867_c0_g1_i1.p1 TRINITY_DN8867_c0_g1~~TRINITY_DN8867_c0_g1_i1.p1  ORF type:complete len:526 (+),score=92.64 TRINITY_DN8867_c0_g1_i1:162-1739(+)
MVVIRDVDTGEVDTIDKEKLIWWRKLLYGFGNFSRYIILSIQGFYLNVFFLEVAGLSAFWAGNVLLIKQVFDACLDPFAGRITDVFQTRFGRRKPWVLGAIVPLGVMWIFLWYNPPIDSEAWKIVYFVIVIIIFSLFKTLVSVPYNAMVPDIAVDYHDRTVVVTYQQVLALISQILFTFYWGLMISEITYVDNTENNETISYGVAAISTAPFMVISMIIAVLSVTERRLSESEKERNRENRSTKEFIKSIISVFTKPACLLILFFVLATTCTYLFSNNVVLFCKYVLGDDSTIAFVLLCAQIAQSLSFFIWMLFSKKFGKKITFYAGACIWAFASLLFFALGDGDIIYMYFIMVLFGVGSSVGYLIPLALIPDLIEFDAAINGGVYREGLIYALILLVQKVGVGIGMTFSNYVLSLFGYESPSEEMYSDYYSSRVSFDQPDSVIFALRILVSFVIIFLLIISCIVLYFLPLHKPDKSKQIFDSDDESDIEYATINKNSYHNGPSTYNDINIDSYDDDDENDYKDY